MFESTMSFQNNDTYDAELDKVAQAYKALQKVKNNYQIATRSLPFHEVSQDMLERISREMIEAITKQGLDLETYNQTLEAAQKDEELKRELLDRLEDK